MKTLKKECDVIAERDRMATVLIKIKES